MEYETEWKKEEIKWKEDYSLVQKFIAGDSLSGQNLYENLELFLFYYLKKQFKTFSISKEELEDLQLDIICATIRDINKYTGKSKFSTWVIGYARNFVYRKRQQILKEHIRFKRLILSYSETFLDPSILLLKKEKSEMLMQQLKKLEYLTYQIFYLRFFHEKTFHEIATAIDITYAEVLQKYRTGVLVLRELVEPYFKIL